MAGEEVSITCIDSSPEMIDYARQLTKEMITKHARDNTVDTSVEERFQYIHADMRNFSVPESSFDTAWILLGSLQHLTTNQDVIDCFRCVHHALAPHGTMFVELPHPREWLGMIDCTRNSWIVPLETQDDEDQEDSKENGQLEIVWGDEDDLFDPITQTRQFTVQFEMKTSQNDHEKYKLRQVVPMRMFTAPEMDLLARSTGFRLVNYFGALEDGVDVNDEDTAFRMVCAFQKIE